jgi:hypothetical protein
MKQLPSQKRLRALFLYADGQLLWKESMGGHRVAGRRAGSVEPKGYRVVRVDGSLFKEHRVIWKWFYGKDPSDQLDHVNRIKTDNRIENLEEVDNRKNVTRARRRKNMPTGVYEKGAKFSARMWKNGKNLFLGYYGTIEEAAEAYNEALRQTKRTDG